MIQVGKKYRHFKSTGGNDHTYKVIALAKCSETLQPMVVYQALYGDKDTWVRPATMWDDLKNGIPRFSLIQDKVK